MSNSEGMTTPSDRLRLPRTCMKSRVTANRKGKSCCSSYILQSTAALSFLHARRLVHRDVKLENVLLYDSGCRLVKLGDFGVARHCGTVVCRVCAGTEYTAPEVCTWALCQTYRVHPATDVWAYGVVLVALMTDNFTCGASLTWTPTTGCTLSSSPDRRSDGGWRQELRRRHLGLPVYLARGVEPGVECGMCRWMGCCIRI